MTSGDPVGSTAGLWRFPVKSMLGERADALELTARGFVGDRAYGLIDSGTGKVVSAKSVRHFPEMLGYRAAFVEPPRLGGELPPVRISRRDGTSVTSDAAECDAVLSGWLGRDVRLESVAPEDFTIDQYHLDVEGMDPAGHRDTIVEQKLGSAAFAELGIPSPVPVGAFFDAFPVTVLTTSTLARLHQLSPGSRFDERRFRMNVIVETEGEGFLENGWVGRALALGDSVRLRVAMPDPRCVMTTLAQEDLPRDNDVLRTLTRHNRLDVGGGRLPCAGVFAVVETPGTVRTGDAVHLTPNSRDR